MKKILAFMVTFLFLGTFTGCGSDNRQNDEASTNPERTFNLTAKIDEQEIYNKDGFIIKAKSLDTKKYEDEGKTMVVLNVYAENKSNKDVAPEIYDTAINGILTSTREGSFWLPSSSKDPKYYKNESYFVLGYIEDASNYNTTLADIGITDVASIDFEIVVTDPNEQDQIGITKQDHIIATQAVSLKTNLASSYTQTKPNPEGKEIYNENGVRIVTLGLTKPYYEEEWCAVRLFVENNSDETFTIKKVFPMTINETLINLKGQTELLPLANFRPNTCAYTRLTINKLDVKRFGIDESAALKTLICSLSFCKVDYLLNDTVILQTPEITMTFE